MFHLVEYAEWLQSEKTQGHFFKTGLTICRFLRYTKHPQYTEEVLMLNQG